MSIRFIEITDNEGATFGYGGEFVPINIRLAVHKVKNHKAFLDLQKETNCFYIENTYWKFPMWVVENTNRKFPMALLAQATNAIPGTSGQFDQRYSWVSE